MVIPVVCLFSQRLLFCSKHGCFTQVLWCFDMNSQLVLKSIQPIVSEVQLDSYCTPCGWLYFRFAFTLLMTLNLLHDTGGLFENMFVVFLIYIYIEYRVSIYCIHYSFASTLTFKAYKLVIHEIWRFAASTNFLQLWHCWISHINTDVVGIWLAMLILILVWNWLYFGKCLSSVLFFHPLLLTRFSVAHFLLTQWNVSIMCICCSGYLSKD